MAQQTQLSALGLSGRKSGGFLPKAAAPVVSADVGQARKRKKPVRKPELVTAERSAEIWAQHVRAAEERMWANAAKIAQARKQMAINHDTRLIQRQEQRAVRDPDAELVKKIEPVVRRVVDEVLEERDTDD